MKISNKVMLITYGDSLGKNLSELRQLLDKHYREAVGGVHILPFFPSSADRGFAPLCYDEVDHDIGSMEDIRRLSKEYYLMFDFMVNHISKQSKFFKDFQDKKDLSPYKDFFIRYKDFWENGEPTQEQIDTIYKRKPKAPCIEVEFKDGTSEKVWCTFGEEQIDLNIESDVVQAFIKDSIETMCENGASIIRLDAFAYAVKKANTNCFFVEPEMWNLLDEIQRIAGNYEVQILPEIHEHYSIQIAIAKKGYWIYDFALPMLVLHAIYSGKATELSHWINMCPMKQFTTLDTHDGIGVVDVKDLLTDEDIENTKENMFTYGANVKKIYNTMAYNNLDIYQVNCTYYSALGNKDDVYLLARAIQFFAPGIPMVYYVGLLAGANDLEFMERTKQGRDINRHYFSAEEVEACQDREIVRNIKKLMVFRNTHPSFDLRGSCEASVKEGGVLVIRRTFNDDESVLEADFKNHSFDIYFTDAESNFIQFQW